MSTPYGLGAHPSPPDGVFCDLCGVHYPLGAHPSALDVLTFDDDAASLAATPDPDAPDCEFCGGGLRHFPECREMVIRLDGLPAGVVR